LVRETPWTSTPACAKRRHNAEPINPLAPVTSARRREIRLSIVIKPFSFLRRQPLAVDTILFRSGPLERSTCDIRHHDNRILG
jgi:hypothetical protein